jgi:hypothetical protein
MSLWFRQNTPQRSGAKPSAVLRALQGVRMRQRPERAWSIRWRIQWTELLENTVLCREAREGA